MRRFRVECVATAAPSRRFARVFVAVSEAEALRAASLALAAEPVDFYVVSIVEVA